jgi:hypothetical protein
VKKVSERSVNCVEKLHKPPSFYARKGEIKSFCYSKQLIILVVYKEVYFNTNKLDLIIPSICVSLLQKFDDVFQKQRSFKNR